jgi:hypothetical protein
MNRKKHTESNKAPQHSRAKDDLPRVLVDERTLLARLALLLATAGRLTVYRGRVAFETKEGDSGADRGTDHARIPAQAWLGVEGVACSSNQAQVLVMTTLVVG